MTWSAKTPYAMFASPCGRRRMLAYHDSVLDKEEMKRLWDDGVPIVKGNVECEKLDVRHLDLVYADCGFEGNYFFFWFESSNGTFYPMFADDAGELLGKDALRKRISGDFKMVRHGTHFGIAPA